MTDVFITVYRQRTLPKINEERSVQGQINQIIQACYCYCRSLSDYSDEVYITRGSGMININLLGGEYNYDVLCIQLEKQSSQLPVSVMLCIAVCDPDS